MFSSVPLAREIGLAVLFTAVLVRLLCLGRVPRDERPHHAGPSAATPATTPAEELPVIPATPAIPAIPAIPGQRTAAAHPMESVELTEAEEQAFAGLVRRFSPMG
ncbi:hypothetical protein [Streptomyces sp. NPDC089799]|uniref:hypothetical protein n=1 Tax=Streptomyces sp. NPDC089799 TaxID=3155066 RepID=UPI00341E9321